MELLSAALNAFLLSALIRMCRIAEENADSFESNGFSKLMTVRLRFVLL